MRGCACLCCAEHRRLDRQQALAAREAAALTEWGPLVDVLIGRTASADFRRAIGTTP